MPHARYARKRGKWVFMGDTAGIFNWEPFVTLAAPWFVRVQDGNLLLPETPSTHSECVVRIGEWWFMPGKEVVNCTESDDSALGSFIK